MFVLLISSLRTKRRSTPQAFDAKPEEYAAWFDKCKEALHHERGIPKDHRVHQLLSVCYNMEQNPNESVADFVHRFAEHLHALKEFIPGIHCPSPGTDKELIHAFALKLG